MARDRETGLERLLSGAFDLPRDAVANLPRLTAVGHRELTIDNHRGLVRCSPEQVVIGVEGGQIAVSGQDLVLEHAYRHRIHIIGRIGAIQFER